jgi:hypothetical protein
MAETNTEMQMRLLLERQCRSIAEALRPVMPAGIGFILFLSDYGERGNVAYVSTIERDDVIKLLHEWLDREDANADAKSLRELLVSAGDLLDTIARAAGFPVPIEDPTALVEHVARLRERAGG